MLTVDQGDTGAIRTALADTLKVAFQKVCTADLQTFLNNLRRKLVHAVLSCVAKYMVDGPTSILGNAMLADMLNTPIAELPVSDNVDAREDFIDTSALCRNS